jgi:hypothetical protein
MNRFSWFPDIPAGNFTAYKPPTFTSVEWSKFSQAVVMNRMSKFGPPKQQHEDSFGSVVGQVDGEDNVTRLGIDPMDHGRPFALSPRGIPHIALGVDTGTIRNAGHLIMKVTLVAQCPCLSIIIVY